MLFIVHWLDCSFKYKTVDNNGVRKASSGIIVQTGTMTTISSSNTAAETGPWKTEMRIDKNFRISECSMGNFPIVAPDVWEHYSPSLESTGVISYKFQKKPLKWAFI